MAKCIIVGAGEFAEKSLSIEEGDFLIAADAGLTHLEQLHIHPHMVIGDFDSLNRIPHHENVLTLPIVKDDTDMGVALEEGFQRGYRMFHIYGGCGGRIDHTLANIQLMVQYAKKGAKALLIGNHQVIQLLAGPGEVCFPASAKGIVSVFAHSDACIGVCEEGLFYSLEDYTMTNDTPLGVSNEFTGKEAKISLEKGILMIVTERYC